MLEPLIRLRNAIVDGSLPITKRLLNRYPDLWVNTDPFNNGWSNLHYAAYHGSYLICFHLVTLQKNKNSRRRRSNSNEYTTSGAADIDNFTDSNSDDSNEIHSLSDNEDAETDYALNSAMQELLTFDRLTVLHLPSINHQSQTLHYLLKEFPGKIWLNLPGGDDRQTPLHYSCKYGFKEGMELFLEYNADYMMVDVAGNNCLHLCFQFGHFNCMKSLLKHFASISKSKEELEELINAYEGMKNTGGWIPVDLASSFTLSSLYKHMKLELISNYRHVVLENSEDDATKKKYHNRNTLQVEMVPMHSGMRSISNPLLSPSTFPYLIPQSGPGLGFEPPSLHVSTNLGPGEFSSPSSTTISTFSGSLALPIENKVLASPIVLVLTSKADGDVRKARSSLLTLPSENNSVPLSRPSATRKRSNTTTTPITSTIPGIRGNTQTTPRMSHTPSLKSIAISPLVRNYENSNPNDVKSLMGSPKNTKMSSSPNNIINQTTPYRGRGSISYNSPSYVTLSPKNDLLNSNRLGVSTQAVGGQALDFLKSSTPSAHSRKSSFGSTSTSSIAAKIAFTSHNNSRPSLGESVSDVETLRRSKSKISPTKELAHLLRKTKSTTTIGNPKYSTISSSPIIASPLYSSHSESADADAAKRKPQISSISFSRVGR